MNCTFLVVAHPGKSGLFIAATLVSGQLQAGLPSSHLIMPLQQHWV